jgi:hypothetical protein
VGQPTTIVKVVASERCEELYECIEVEVRGEVEQEVVGKAASREAEPG